MDFLYDNVRNRRHGLRSEKRQYGGSAAYILQLVDMQTNGVIQEKVFYNWSEYSQWYQQMVLMLQSAP
jgi:hypothetical protein